jgi:hypothetical protein
MNKLLIGEDASVKMDDSLLKVGDGGITKVRIDQSGEMSINGGNIRMVGGDILFEGSADCAEEFEVLESEKVEQGTVMVFNKQGSLQPSSTAYDRKVTGVVSGAGDLKPGIVLDKQPKKKNRLPVALIGKVYCKVDAQYASVEIGDLLTSSPTSGHAMKVKNPLKAFGAVIGKAMKPLTEGQGLIPIMVTMQ